MEIDSLACDRAGRRVVRAGPIEIDLAAHRVRRNGHSLHLGPTEFRLLHFFVQHPEHVFSREELLENVWTGKSIEVRAVDVYVRRLREALGPDQNVIRTVRGFGYSFEETRQPRSGN